MKYFTHHHDLGDDEQLEVQVRYRKDHGVSWYHGKPYKRGLVLDFTPCRLHRGDGYVTKTYTLGDNRGQIIFLEELKRQSDKKGQGVAAFVQANIERIVEAGATQDWAGVAAIMREHYA
jgi:hypothetical protein